MINTRFSVALHIMVELARNPGANLTSAILATRVNTHAVAVRRIVRVLKEAGLVRSIQGPNGGVCLLGDADTIPLSQIAELTGENMGFATHRMAADEDRSNTFSDAVLSTIESEQRKAHLAAMSHLDGITVKNILDASVLRSELNDLVAQGLSDQQIRWQYHIVSGHLVKK